MLNPSRRYTAFAIAPAIVPLVMLLHLWAAAVFFIAAVFAYLGTICLGFPTLVFLWDRGYRSLWTTLVAGCVIGALTWLAFGLLLSLSLGNSASDSVRLTLERTYLMGILWPAGVCSLLVAATLWLIARPDRMQLHEA